MAELEEVTLSELLDLHADARQTDLHVAMPALVESYDYKKQTVDVIPQLNRALSDGSGNYVTEKLPKLPDVPVVFPRCGAFGITFPLAKGDFVLLVFCERSLGAWRAIGAQGDPGDLAMHGLDGAVAIPGLYPDKLPAATADGTKMRVGSDTDGRGQIEFTATEVRLGQGATKGIARTGDAVAIDLTSLQNSLDARYSHAGTPIGTPVNAAISGGSAHAKAID